MVCIMRNWCRISSMSDNRLFKRVFMWADRLAGNKNKNWIFHVKQYFNSIQMSHLSNTSSVFNRGDLNDLDGVLSEINEQNWFEKINQDLSSRVNKGRNKLRTYKLFKKEYATEHYVSCILPRNYRSSFAKFRCGVAPIGLEIGRYFNIPENQRLCQLCTSGEVESEKHVLLNCSLYNDLRYSLFNSMSDSVPGFNQLSSDEQLCHILSGIICVPQSAKTCHLILQRRRAFISGAV